MFRFFRQIRKTLMEQNKIRTYILYGIGEIFLVMIGILLALQVNNWNEERKNRAYELTMLEEVHKELIADSERIESNILYLKRVQHSFRELSVMKNDPGHNLDSLDFHLQMARGYGITLTINKSPFEAIKSGGLDRISNQEIRNNVSTLFGLHVEAADKWINEVLRVELFTRNDIVYELFDPVAVPSDYGAVTMELTIENPSLLFKNPKFDELLFRSSWPISGTINRLTSVLEEMRILSDQIAQELKN